VILISFTKFLQIAVSVLSYASLEYSNGTSKRVWLYDANHYYFEGRHALLAIVTLCVVITFLIPYTFLLLFGFRIQRYSSKKYLTWINRFKPLLDAYYAPFKKETRYWAGFTLLIRGCLFFGVSNELSNNNVTLVAVSVLFMVILVFPWLSKRIYEKLYLDLLEASFLLNIGVLAIVTYYVRNMKDGNQAAVTYISVAIAFIEFVGVVLFHIYLRIKSIGYFNILKFKGLSDSLMLRSAISTEKEQEENSVSVTTTTFVDIREPLLEEN